MKKKSVETMKDIIDIEEAKERGETVEFTDEALRQYEEAQKTLAETTKRLKPQLEAIEKERQRLRQQFKENLTNAAPALEYLDALMKDTQAQVREFQAKLQKIKEEHAEAWEVMDDKEKRNAFIETVTIKDFENCYPDEEIPEYIIKAFNNGTDEEKKEAFGHLTPKVFITIYEYKKSKKKEYRTISKAGVDVQRNMPNSLAIPSYEPFRYSMSLNQEGNAYLQPLVSTDGLKFQSGRLYFDGERMKQVSEVELQNMKTKEGIENIDLPFLRVVYSLILKDYQDHKLKFTAKTHKWYIPTFAQYLGLSNNLSKKNTQAIIDKVQSYHNITGILHGTRNGNPVQSLYQVLNFESYDDKTNTIEISSPYMRFVIEAIYTATIKKAKNGTPLLKKNGDPIRIASHSYLIHADIAKEKNKSAVENVFIIVSGIEQSGNRGYHIAATTLIERNPQLKEALAKSANKRQLLKRCFKKTFELLRTKTDLDKAYIDIILPDPNNPANVPTVSNLDGLVINISHNGKNPNYAKQL